MHTRTSHFRAIFFTWWSLVYGAWGLLCSADVIVSHFADDTFKTKWNVEWITPKFGWRIWLYGMALITLIFIFEVSFQLVRAAKKETAEIKEDLEWPVDRPQIAFHSWGQIQPQFAPPGAVSTDTYIFQHGFYLDNDGGAALEVTVESFKFGLFHTLSETISRIAGKDKGFANVRLEKEDQVSPLAKWALDMALLNTWGALVDKQELNLHESLVLPISVVYRDYNNIWYRTKSELRFIARFGGVGCSISFGPPIQEKMPRPQALPAQR